MSLKITMTITVTDPDGTRQHQAKDTATVYDPTLGPHQITDAALQWLADLDAGSRFQWVEGEEIEDAEIEEDEETPALETAST